MEKKNIKNLFNHFTTLLLADVLLRLVRLRIMIFYFQGEKKQAPAHVVKRTDELSNNM